MTLWLGPAVFPAILDSCVLYPYELRCLLLEEGLSCDPGDRHVLAAAVAAKAEVIVTQNIRHFPAASTAPLGIQAVTPDQFLCNLLDLGAAAIHGCLDTMAEQQRNPSRSVETLLKILSREAPIFSSRCLEFLIRPQT